MKTLRLKKIVSWLESKWIEVKWLYCKFYVEFGDILLIATSHSLVQCIAHGRNFPRFCWMNEWMNWLRSKGNDRAKWELQSSISQFSDFLCISSYVSHCYQCSMNNSSRWHRAQKVMDTFQNWIFAGIYLFLCFVAVPINHIQKSTGNIWFS